MSVTYYVALPFIFDPRRPPARPMFREYRRPLAPTSKTSPVLLSFQNAFATVDREVNAALLPVRQRLGIKEEWLEEHTKKMMQEMKDGQA
jgi:hypothetical protein